MFVFQELALAKCLVIQHISDFAASDNPPTPLKPWTQHRQCDPRARKSQKIESRDVDIIPPPPPPPYPLPLFFLLISSPVSIIEP